MAKEIKAKDLPAKLRAILTLSREGATAGEREAARIRLSVLLDAYDMTIEQIDDSNTSTYWFAYRNKFEKELLFQVYRYTVADCPATFTYKTKKGKRSLGFTLTAEQCIDFGVFYSHWRAKLAEDMSLFFNAFILQNKIVGVDEVESATEDEVDEKTLKVWAMQKGIERTTPHRQLKG